MNADSPCGMALLGDVDTQKMGVLRGKIWGDKRSPNRVLAGPRSGLLATNLSDQKGA